MAFTGVLAQATVGDIATAEDWYERLFERGPDVRPMDGLIGWHIGDGNGVQVFSEPDRAGDSTIVLQVDDLDAVGRQVRDAGLTEAEPERATGSRILQMTDPDGNRVVIIGD